jgi:hypothetical protein
MLDKLSKLISIPNTLRTYHLRFLDFTLRQPRAIPTQPIPHRLRHQSRTLPMKPLILTIRVITRNHVSITHSLTITVLRIIRAIIIRIRPLHIVIGMVSIL